MVHLFKIINSVSESKIAPKIRLGFSSVFTNWNQNKHYQPTKQHTQPKLDKTFLRRNTFGRPPFLQRKAFGASASQLAMVRHTHISNFGRLQSSEEIVSVVVH
jgi:hypothetical protein